MAGIFRVTFLRDTLAAALRPAFWEVAFFFGFLADAVLADEAAVRASFLARRFFAMEAFQADSREFDGRRQTAARRVDSTRFRTGQSAEGPVSYESKPL